MTDKRLDRANTHASHTIQAKTNTSINKNKSKEFLYHLILFSYFIVNTLKAI